MRTTEKDYCGYDIKGRDNFNGYHGNHDNELLFACLQQLGKLEDLMEKYNIKTLEQVESAFISFVSDYTEEGRNHIGELLKLEKELGIDLITLSKALKNGVWIKHKKAWEAKYKIEYFEPNEFAICFHGDSIMFCQVRYFGDEYEIGRSIEIEGDFDETHYFGTSNYGKTWALTKQELKKNG